MASGDGLDRKKNLRFRLYLKVCANGVQLAQQAMMIYRLIFSENFYRSGPVGPACRRVRNYIEQALRRCLTGSRPLTNATLEDFKYHREALEGQRVGGEGCSWKRHHGGCNSV